MKVKVKKLNEDAVIPSRAYDRDFGYDVVAISEEQRMEDGDGLFMRHRHCG